MSIIIQRGAGQSQSVQPAVGSLNGSSGSITIVAGGAIGLTNNASTISISAPTQTVQTQNLHNVSLSGNTAGVMAQISSGTMSLAGGNNITLSQNGNAVTISGPNTVAQTVQPAVGSLNGSSGTMSIVAGGAIGLTNNASTISITAPTQTIQPVGSFGVSNIGNTAGTSGTVTNQLVLAGGNNITLSQSTAAGGITVTVSAPNQSIQPAVGSLNGSSGTMSIIAGGAIGLTNNASTISITSPTQTAESNTFGISNLGNTAGTSGTVASNQARILFAGGNNITLSQSTNGGSVTITISGVNTVAQSVVPGIQSIQVSNTTYTTGNVIFSNANGLSFGSSAGGAITASYTVPNVPAQTVQTQNFIALSASNNAYTSGTVVLSGGTNITVSTNGQTVSVVGPTNILNSLSISGNTGTTNSSNITGGGFVIAGGANITLSQSNNTISIVGLAPSGGAFSAGVSGGNTSNTSGITGTRVVFAGGNNITLSQSNDANGASITISAFTQTVQTQNFIALSASNNLYTSGTVILSGGTNVTVSTNGQTVSIVGPTNILNSLSISGNTATTNSSNITGGGFVLAGGANITLQQSNNTISISAPTPVAQTNQTLSWAMTSNTTGNTSAITIDARSLTLQGKGDISVGISTSAGGTSLIVSGTQSVVPGIQSIQVSNTTYTTGNVIFSNANGLSFGSSAGGAITASYTVPTQTNQTLSYAMTGNTTGNTSGVSVDARSLTVQGLGAASVGISTSAGGTSLIVSSPAQSVVPGIQSIQVSNTTYTTGNVIFSNANGLSFGSSAGGAITASYTVPTQTNQTLSFAMTGNTTGNTSGMSVDARSLSIQGLGAVSVGLSTSAGGSSVLISVPTGASATGNFGALSASNNLYSSGTVVLSGGTNITVSTNGQTVSVVGPTNILNSLSISGNTATTNSSNITGGGFVLAGGANITLQQSNNTISISAPTPVAQTNQTLSYAMTGNTTGNTSGVSIDARSLTIQGLGAASVGISTSAGGTSLIVSSPTQTVQTQNFIALSASNNLYSSGTVILSGGTNVTVSTNGQTVSVVGPTNILNSLSISGNTGTTNSSNITGGGFVIAGGANITLSQSNNTISIVGLAPSGGAFSAGVSGGNTSNTSGITGTRVVFAGGNNITLSQSNDANGASITISAFTQTVQTQNFVALSASNNLYSSGTVILSGGTNITVSTNGQTVSVVGPTNILNSLSISGNTATTNSSNITGGGFVLAGGANITLLQSNNTISISASPGGGAGFSAGVSGGNTSNTSGLTGTNLAFAGGNNITLSQSNDGNGATITISGVNTVAQSVVPGIQSIQVSNTTYTTGNVIFSNANGLSFGSSAGGAITASYTVPTQSVVPGIQSIQVSNTTYTTGNVIFSNANGLSFGSSAGGAITASYTVPTQTVQTQNFIALSASNNAYTSGTVVLSGGTNITVSTNGQTVSIVGPANILNSFSLGGNTATTNSSNITGGGFVLAGGNNVTLQQSNNTISISIPNDQSVGVSNVGNTLGNTSMVTGNVIFAGGNNITLSQSTGANGVATITISGANNTGATTFQAGISNLGNTLGVSGTINNQIVFAGSNLTLSQSVNANSATITVIGQPGLYSFEPYPLANSQTTVLPINNATSAAASFFPFQVDDQVFAGMLNLAVSMSFVTVGGNSGRQSQTMQYALYSQGSGTNSTTMSQMTSASFGLFVTGNNSTYSISQPTSSNTAGYTTGSTTSAGVNISSGYTGGKLIAFPVQSTLSPGMYWLGIVCVNSTSSVNVGISQSLIGGAIATTIANMAPIGSFSSAYSTGTNVLLQIGGNWHMGHASFSSANQTNLPATVAFSAMTHNLSVLPYIRLWSNNT